MPSWPIGPRRARASWASEMTRKRQDAAQEPTKAQEPASSEAVARTAINADMVAAWLRRHPDFLARHPDILDSLDPPATPGLEDAGRSVIDMQQAMVLRLRQENEELRRTRDEMVTTLRSNLHSQHKIHEAVITLLSAQSFEHLIETISNEVMVLLDLDATSLCVENETGKVPQMHIGRVQCLPADSINALFGPSARVILRDHQPGDPALFGPASELVQSDAILRLSISGSTPPALLALGSRDPDHFSNNQGTELLQFLGLCLERLIRGWLEIPE